MHRQAATRGMNPKLLQLSSSLPIASSLTRSTVTLMMPMTMLPTLTVSVTRGSLVCYRRSVQGVLFPRPPSLAFSPEELFVSGGYVYCHFSSLPELTLVFLSQLVLAVLPRDAEAQGPAARAARSRLQLALQAQRTAGLLHVCVCVCVYNCRT